MIRRIANALRWLADRIAPRPVVVYPQDGAVQFKGERYKLAELRLERIIPPDAYDTANEETIRDYFKRRMASELGASATQAIQWETSKDKINAKLLILYNEST